MANFSMEDGAMHDEQHPYRVEGLDYSQQVEALETCPWYGGTLLETKSEWICSRPDWDVVIVIDRELLVLSFLDETGRSN